MAINKDEFYEIQNSTLGGAPFTEGVAKIIKHEFGNNYLVEFENGDRVSRFVLEGDKVS